jgi:non-heme dioxygenase-like protein
LYAIRDENCAPLALRLWFHSGRVGGYLIEVKRICPTRRYVARALHYRMGVRKAIFDLANPQTRRSAAMPLKSIPVIDISPFKNGEQKVRKQVADRVAEACTDIGFLVISGHGIPSTVIKDMVIRPRPSSP